MAGPANRMVLLQNGKSFPFHLLRGSLLRGSNAINVEPTQFISDPAKLQPQQKPVFNLLDAQPIAGPSNVDGVVNWRFGEFGKMGHMEAAKRVISDDEQDEEDYSDVEFDDEMIEDMDKEFDDDDEEDEDDSDLDDDDVVDVRKRK